jgi:Domain of unknown function (DUF4333)
MAALPLVAAACGGPVHSGPDHSAAAASVNKHDVARGASDQFGSQTNEPAPTIVCPNDLPARVGATEQCAETDYTRGQRHETTVRINQIQGNNIQYTVDVGTTPLPPPDP